MMMISTALSAVGQIIQGKQQQDVYNAQAQEAANAAAYEADAFKQQAKKIRRAAQAQHGETAATLAGAGVKLGEGTPLELKKTIQQRAEEDVLAAMVSGNRAIQAGQAQASVYRSQGSAAMTSGIMGAGKTVLGSAIDYKRGGWQGT
jgi:hypothetical protein